MSGCLRFFAAILMLLLLAVAYRLHLLHFVALAALPAMAAITLMERLWSALSGRVLFDFFWRPLRPAYRPQLRQYLIRSSSYLLLALVQTLAINPVSFPANEYAAMLILFLWGPALGLLVLELFPTRTVRRLWNTVLLVGSMLLVAQLFQIFVIPVWSEKIVLQAPFRGEWMVFQGGRSSFVNHHFSQPSQRHAVDFVALKHGQYFAGNADRTSSHFAFGQRLLAPADGLVVKAVDYRLDLPMGDTDRLFPVGNYLVIEMSENKYVLLAHLMRGSIRVREGEFVKSGDFIARCGNSGNTTLPHLHIQVQNHSDWQHADLKTYPMTFRGVRHHRWGFEWSKQRGELIRNDRIEVRDLGKQP